MSDKTREISRPGRGYFRRVSPNRPAIVRSTMRFGNVLTMKFCMRSGVTV